MLGWLLALLPLHGATRLLGRRSLWPRRFLGGIGRIAGARVAVRGTPLPAPVLYLANHQSWLDIMILADVTGSAFVSKAEVSRWPLFGWLAALNNTIFIARERRSGVRNQADALRDGLSSGQPIALFAEGTTSDGTGVLPFNASLLGAAVEPADARVQPVAIVYTPREDIAWFGEEAAGANVMRVLARRGRFDVTLTFLAAVEPRDDRKRIATKAHDAVRAALHASDCVPPSL